MRYSHGASPHGIILTKGERGVMKFPINAHQGIKLLIIVPVMFFLLFLNQTAAEALAFLTVGGIVVIACLTMKSGEENVENEWWKYFTEIPQYKMWDFCTEFNTHDSVKAKDLAFFFLNPDTKGIINAYAKYYIADPEKRKIVKLPYLVQKVMFLYGFPNGEYSDNVMIELCDVFKNRLDIMEWGNQDKLNKYCSEHIKDAADYDECINVLEKNGREGEKL